MNKKSSFGARYSNNKELLISQSPVVPVTTQEWIAYSLLDTTPRTEAIEYKTPRASILKEHYNTKLIDVTNTLGDCKGDKESATIQRNGERKASGLGVYSMLRRISEIERQRGKSIIREEILSMSPIIQLPPFETPKPLKDIP